MSDRFQLKTEHGRVISIEASENESEDKILLETSDSIGASSMTKTCLSKDEAMQIRDALTELLN